MAARNPLFGMLPQGTATHDEFYEDIAASSDEDEETIKEMNSQLLSEEDEQIKEFKQYLEGINCGHANCNLFSS